MWITAAFASHAYSGLLVRCESSPSEFNCSVWTQANVRTSTPNQTADCLFNWAEKTYPTLFAPGGVPSSTASPYYYRYYSSTKNYLAVSSADNHIWVLGPISGNVPLDVAPVANFLATAGCP